MIHLQAHYHTILTFGTKYKSLYRNDHTIYTNTLNIHLFGIFLVRTVSQEARSLTYPQFWSPYDSITRCSRFDSETFGLIP